MKLPFEIEYYIETNKIDSSRLFHLVTTNKGLVVSVGNSSDLFIVSPIVGEHISAFLPALEGLLLSKENLYLPNIQLNHGRFFNIHILPLSDSVWILFQDVSFRIKEIRHQIEMQKEWKKCEFVLLEALDYYVLKRNGNEGYVPISKLPDWMLKILGREDLSDDILTRFPFLEFFLEQIHVNPFHDKADQNYSGIWTQNTTDGAEIHLNAWLFQVVDDFYLVIHPVNYGLASENNIIQLARENSLAYEQLAKTKKQLQELLTLKDQFVSIVSHDFRSPIAALIDGVSFLIDDLSSANSYDDSHREIIHQVKDELTRLLDYNNKLYNWTKLNLDSLEINETKVALGLLMSNLEAQFQSRLVDKKIKLKVEFEDDFEIHTDYVLFNQALTNIIDNSIKFSHENSTLTITLTAKFLRIEDEGIGMLPQKIEEILKGYSLKSTHGTKGEVGTGLGLNIVTRILKTLGHRLHINSEMGKGTSFTIFFNETSFRLSSRRSHDSGYRD